MDDAQRPPLTSDTILRGMHARKRSAMRKMSVGRSIQKHGADLEREGAAELADVEAFERRRDAIFKVQKQFYPSGSGSPAADDMSELEAADRDWKAALAVVDRIVDEIRSGKRR